MEWVTMTAAGSIGNVRMFDTDTRTKKFESAAGTGGFNLRGFKEGGFTEFFGDDRCEGVGSGGSHSANVIPGRSGLSAHRNI